MNSLNLIQTSEIPQKNYIKTDRQSIEMFFDHFDYTNYLFFDYENETIDENKKYTHIILLDKSLSDICKNSVDILIEEKIKNLVRKYKNIFVILYYSTESDYDDLIIIFDEYLKINKLNPLQFNIVNGNSNLYELKKKNNSEINVFTCNFLHSGHVVQIKQNLPFDLIDNYKVNKKYKFSCYNRRMCSHRLTTLCYLKKNNILENVNWSMLRGYDIEKEIKCPLFFNGVTNIDDIKTEIDFFSKINIKQADLENDIILDTGTHAFHHSYAFNRVSYIESYINIVTESIYTNNNTIFITEKSIYPFFFLQIPIFIATKHHIKKLRELYNLDFFDDLINHSYDEEEDGVKRLKMVFDEINKLNNMGDGLILYYQENKDRIIQNNIEISKIGDFDDTKKFFNSFV